MKVFVNTRLICEVPTGIHNYIYNLFNNITKIDEINKYYFLQPKELPSLGQTLVTKTLDGILGAFLFDLFLGQSKVVSPGVYHGMSFILPLFKKRGIKYVVSVHDLSFLIFPKNHSLLFNIYYKYALKFSLKRADKIIAISQNTKNDIVGLFDIKPDKIAVTYLAGDEGLTSLYEKVERIIEGKYFFAVSTHPKRKNIISILKALASSECLKQYKFVLAGKIDGSQLEELQILIKDLKIENNLKILGYVSKEDLASLYKYAEFFIYPSFYEGFGIPVVDALNLKCPVITSNTSCLPEVVPEGYNFLVDPYSVEDIKQKMENMIELSSSERIALIEKNLQFSKRFSWVNTARLTIDMYNSL